MQTKNIEGREYPITAYIAVEKLGTIPLVNIRMMSDERERELAAQSKGAAV